MLTDKWFLLWMSLTFLALVSGEEILISAATPDSVPDFMVFDRSDHGNAYVEPHSIHKRAAVVNSTQETDGSKHIISYVTRLNTSHQQLLVHWSGMGSDVLICLAKNNQPLGYKQNPTPSALYISYDYGKTFVNKTEFFKLKDGRYASLDKFFFHKREKKYMIFIDKFNRMIFTTKDFGKNIVNHTLHFEPAEVLTHPYDPWIFVVYDAKQKLRITNDFGQSFTDLQEMVKSYFWMDIHPPGKSTTEVALIVQRIEPTYSTALALTFGQEKPRMRVLISKIDQLLSSGNFIFAIRKLPSNNSSELFISYRGGDFLHTEFDSNLNKKSFHVTDTSDTRIMMAVSHTETLSNLYVSDLDANQDKYLFRLSLERLFCFFPNVMWVDSWLANLAEGPFADIHKVQGMKGIYLASQVVADAQGKTISPEHLTSVITFDWGGEWKPLEPPKYDMFGRPTNASKTPNVSLHVTQKFSSLYPVTRNIPILTSKSAPGVIIATGTVGASLKGHVGVYVSRDAGLTWNHVLTENYLFNMGDHGGIFTAVKLYKSVGETFEVLYSFDEGETWSPFKFADKPMRIYGLMTEPGENTTVFTIFGSEPEKHEWTIINIDFLKAFQRNCTDEDYKMWSPSSGDPRDKMSCVMGVKETYQRRVRHTQCRNGVGYDRPKSFENCPCDYEDFECDYGFLRHVSSPNCIKNKSLTYDPYAVPTNCKPGQFYQRTKGYRRIEGDQCIGGFEHYYLPDNIPCPLKEPNQFLLLAQKEHIVRFDLLDPQPKTLPINNLHNVIAIDYDMKNNCVYFADIVTDVIGRQCFSTGKEETEILLESSMRSVEGIAFDWISNLLYFVDGNRAKIEVIRTDINHYGRMRYTVLDSKSVKKPRGIVIHPAKGYMFWTDWDEHKPGVNRANMDGSDIKVIRDSSDVHWPNGITIDHISERVYWVDAKLDYIGSADLEGRHFKKILTASESRMHHPFSVAVFKDTMYWDDWTEDSIFMADKDKGTGIQPFAVLYPGLMDVKVFGHSLQVGTNECHPSKNRCSHLCLALPTAPGYRCACPDGMIEHRGECKCLNDHQTPYPNGTCPRASINGSCAEGQFSCRNDNCIPKDWQCDNDNDCGDNSDEIACETPCMGAFFDCGRGKCIPSTWKCDQEQDCEDGRDELHCPAPSCDPGKFKCNNNRCINKRWVCDGENDCKDGSDELNCHNTTVPPKPSNCTGSQFQCHIGSVVQCIPRVWVCDGEKDCSDNADEQNCENNKCDANIQFQCEKSHLCILKSYRCDGSKDCGVGDDSDEKNCSSIAPTPPPVAVNNSCKGWMFRCNNNVCIPSWWKCDDVDDCGDRSDEEGCPGTPESWPTTLPPTPQFVEQCKPFEFRCNSGACIAQSWVCDGSWDCPSGEDEAHCEYDLSRNMTCAPDYFKCKKTRMCIPESNVCDRVAQCPDGSDEQGCNQKPHQAHPENPECNPGFFACDGSRCLPLSKYCNKIFECYDGTDEYNCPTDPLNRTFQVTQFGVDKYQTSPNSLTIFWWVPNAPAPNVSHLQYLPSIAEILDSGVQKWTNASGWTSDMRHTFTNLVPFTKHNITVYVKLVKDNKEFPPGAYITGTTSPSAPSEPREVKVAQKKANLLEVAWLPPIKPNGNISRYEVFYKPPTPPIRQDVLPNNTSVLIQGHFIHGETYTVWVNAVNQAGYQASQIASFTANDASTVGAVNNFVVKSINDTSVTWSWDEVKGADGYMLEVKADYPYPHIPPVKITPKQSFATFSNLAPGVDYTFSIRAYHNTFEGDTVTKGVRTSGAELPVVPGLKATLSPLSGSSIVAQWSSPKLSSTNRYNEKWMYGVYYSTSSDDFFDGAKIFTPDTHVDFGGLSACEKYIIDVGVVAPLGLGPLSASPVTVTTGYDPLAPPKRLRVIPDRLNDTIVHIMWSSSCFNMTEMVGYILTIHDEVTRKTTSITFLPTNNTEREHKLPIHLGGRYELQVQTDKVGSRTTYPVKYVAPPLPSPHQLETHVLTDASHIRVYWGDPSEKIKTLPKFKYELLVSEGQPMNESTATVIPVESSPYDFKDFKTGTLYYFAVRIVTEKGHRSGLSEIVLKEVPLGPWAHVMTPTTVVGVFVPILLVLMIVAGAFIFFVFRHRRLQNNFASFANSHYSTRSGAATFTSDGLGAFDDEDSPVIRGFSDDEPLVVA